jgi:hypothetical protein
MHSVFFLKLVTGVILAPNQPHTGTVRCLVMLDANVHLD